MQDEIARDGESAKEDPEQRDVWPPERLSKADPSALTPRTLNVHGMMRLTPALRPNVERMAAAGTSMLTPYFSSCSWRYLSSFTASASNAAWKNEMVCSHWKNSGTVFRLMSRPVNSKLQNAKGSIVSITIR